MSDGYERPASVTEVVVRETPDPTRPKWIDRARSADHKSIGLVLIVFSLVNYVLAGFMEILTQFQLLVSDGTFLSPERFYALHMLQDTSYLYLFTLPLLAGIATYVLPLQIGARSTAFPRLSALGAWMIVFGAAILYFSTFTDTWQGTVQMSAPLFEPFYSEGPGADLWLTAVMMVAGGLMVNAIDLVVTYRNMRAAGMTKQRTPVFAHASAVFGWGILATAPVMLAAGLMALLERQWGSFGIFNPVDGGDPMLWKTLFQWWSHSAPLLALVLAIGAVSDILATASKRIPANVAVLKRAIVAFAIFSVLSFGTVFFGTPVKPVWSYIFMIAGLAVLVPGFEILQSWYATVRNGDWQPSMPAAFSLVFIGFFVAFLVLHTALSLPVLSQWVDGSQIGYVAWLDEFYAAGALGGFAALLYWFPKMTGRDFAPGPIRIALVMMAVGATVQYLMMFSMGADGMAREVSTYSGTYGLRSVIGVIALLVTALGVIGVLVELMRANAKGLKSGNDPWHAGTLEWFAPSPPPANNFDAVPEITSARPLSDLRESIVAETGDLVGTVAQSPTSGRPSMREADH